MDSTLYSSVLTLRKYIEIYITYIVGISYSKSSLRTLKLYYTYTDILYIKNFNSAIKVHRIFINVVYFSHCILLKKCDDLLYYICCCFKITKIYVYC